MKKRLLMMMAVATLIVSSAMTAFAAPSPEGEATVEIESILDKDGKETDAFEIGALAKDIQESGKSVVGEGFTPFWFELCANEPGTDALMPIKAAFKVDGVKAGDTVKVFYQDATGAWKEVKGAVVTDGKVTVTLAQGGPILISVKAATTSGGTTISPQTGEGNVMFYVALVGMAALAGAVVAKKKAN